MSSLTTVTLIPRLCRPTCLTSQERLQGRCLWMSSGTLLASTFVEPDNARRASRNITPGPPTKMNPITATNATMVPVERLFRGGTGVAEGP